MAWEYSHHLLPLAAAAALSLLLAATAWRFRDRTGAGPLVALGLANAWWALTYVAGLAATTLWVELFAYRLMYLAVAVVPVAWLAFAAEYTGRVEPLDRRQVGALLVVPAVAVGLVWTNGAHGLIWTSVEQVRAGSMLVASTSHGAGFWAFAAYSYLLLAVGSGLVLEMALLSGHVYRVQALLLGVAVLLPWASNGLFLAGLTGVWDLTTLAFAGSCAVLVGTILRRQLLQLVPVAREVARNELIDSMAEAVVVIDEDGRIADLNPAAEDLIEGDARGAIGSPAVEVLPAVSGVVDPAAEEGERTEVAVGGAGRERRYEVQSVPLRWGHGTITGQLLTLRDVTARYEREQRLQDQRQRLEVLNRVLRHDIRNGIQAILLHANRLPADGVDGDAEQAIRSIEHTGREIMELSESARRFESTISGEGTETAVVDLADLVGRIADDLRTVHPGAVLRTDIPGRAPAAATELVGFAVRNVVENAVEHNDRETPTVEVAVDVGESVAIRVADDGPGLPPEERAVLERGSESPLDHSSGLGLWLVTWVVEDCGGEVRIADNDPRGTIITLSFPAATAESLGAEAVTDD